ncbi:lipoprotein [Dactylosporangium sp. NPDC000244]|uniref:lipoprotein n=1 Tax=Dactylosporangium sp. NPDC000244 TaxID=3154365 RepID=UPI0033316CED
MRRILSLVLAAAMLAGCSNDDKSTPAPAGEPSAGTVVAMAHADAQALADKYRTEAVTALGATLTGPPTSSLAPCEGPHTFTAITYGDVPVPVDQQAAALQKLREHYSGAQYTVAPPGADASLNAITSDRVKISIAPEGADTLRINIATACYSSDEPL